MNGDIRLWFRKTGPLRFTSHLDFMRYFGRVLQLSKLPVWYTQGFNQRMYFAFGQPLSLGMSGRREFCDLTLTQDVSRGEILSSLRKYNAQGFEVYDVTVPEMKLGEVAFGEYEALYLPQNASPQELFGKIRDILSLPEYLIQKKTKARGGFKTLDLMPYLATIEFSETPEGVRAHMILPCGSGRENVSPKLIFEAIRDFSGYSIFQQIERIGFYDAEKESFR